MAERKSKRGRRSLKTAQGISAPSEAGITDDVLLDLSVALDHIRVLADLLGGSTADADAASVSAQIAFWVQSIVDRLSQKEVTA